MKLSNPFKKVKEEKSKEKKVGENIVRISIKRLLGDSVPYTIAEFDAIQDRDNSGNLVLINDASNFKEDVEVVQDQLISDLKFTLDLHKIGKEGKIHKLKEAIERQEKFIKSIENGTVARKDKGPDGKDIDVRVKVNKIDEEIKLRRYKVFFESLENSGDGSYEEIDVTGMKKVSYLYKGGILFPYKIINAKNTMFPDITSKRKIYKTEQDIIDKEFMEDNKGFMSGWKQYLWIGLIAIMIIANVYGYTKLSQAWGQFDESKMNELVLAADQSAIKCAYYYATIGEETATFINTINQLNLSSSAILPGGNAIAIN